MVDYVLLTLSLGAGVAIGNITSSFVAAGLQVMQQKKFIAAQRKQVQDQMKAIEQSKATGNN